MRAKERLVRERAGVPLDIGSRQRFGHADTKLHYKRTTLAR